MRNDDRAQQLHDRATRGITLSPEEQADLEHWYAQLDQEEEALLNQSPASDSLAALKSQVNDALTRLPSVLERVRSLAEANDALRTEITALQRQLEQTTATQSS